MRAELWFKHDLRARTDPKMSYFLSLQGAQGYGVWWMLLEILHYQNDHTINLHTEGAGVAAQCGIDLVTFNSIINSLVVTGLLVQEEDVVYQATLKQSQAESSRAKQNQAEQKVLAGRLGGLKSVQAKREKKNQKDEQIQEDFKQNQAPASNSLDKKRIEENILIDKSINKRSRSQTEKLNFNEITFPPELNTPEAQEALRTWLVYKHTEHGDRYKSDQTVQALLAEWAPKGPEAFIAAVNFSMANRYKGLFSPKKEGQQTTQFRAHTAARTVEKNIEYTKQTEEFELDGPKDFTELLNIIEHSQEELRANEVHGRGLVSVPVRALK